MRKRIEDNSKMNRKKLNSDKEKSPYQAEIVHPLSHLLEREKKRALTSGLTACLISLI